MKNTRLQDINKALGDLPFEPPFLNVNPYVIEPKWSISAQNIEAGIDELLDQVIVRLDDKGFVYEVTSHNGIREIVVVGRN